MFSLKVFLFCVVVAVSLAAESSEKPKVEILSDKTYVREDGYNFAYKTSDGTSRQEEASLITVGEHQGIGIKGSYSYIAPDGLEYGVTFTADEKGFKPQIKVITPDSQ